MLPDYIAARIVVQSNGCWHWTGLLLKGGYGKVGYRRRTWLVHRLVYELLRGPIPARAQLDHRCHNDAADCPGGAECRHRRCCNPAHLEPTTCAVNSRRSPRTLVSVNAAKTHCPAGHEYTHTNCRGHRCCRICDREKAAARRRVA